MSMSSHLLQRGITLWKKGEKEQARNIFKTIIYNDRHDEVAWNWYIYSLENNREKISAIETFLSISPDNEKMKSALASLRFQEDNKPDTTESSSAVSEDDLESQGFTRLVQQPRTDQQPESIRYQVPASKVKSKNSLIIPKTLVILGLLCLCGALSIVGESYRNLNADYQEEKIAHQQVAQQYNQLNTDYQQIENEYNTLKINYNGLQNEYNTLTINYNVLQDKNKTLQASYAELNEKAIVPPYIYIHGREITLAFLTPDQNRFTWKLPFYLLENDLKRGNVERNRIAQDSSYPHLQMKNTITDETFSVIDYRKFVDPILFGNFSQYFYEKAASEEIYIRELWYIVAQLTVYSAEISDTPRYPLETLLAGGGDCEDTAILLASMILAAAPANWEVDLVYLDGDNPTAPLVMNHVLVYVDTGNRRYTIESTSKQVMEPFNQGVNGWYYEINR